MTFTSANSAQASSRKLSNWLRNAPSSIFDRPMCRFSEAKSGWPNRTATESITMFCANASTSFENAAPMMNPSASSTTLPPIANERNSRQTFPMRAWLHDAANCGDPFSR